MKFQISAFAGGFFGALLGVGASILLIDRIVGHLLDKDEASR